MSDIEVQTGVVSITAKTPFWVMKGWLLLILLLVSSLCTARISTIILAANGEIYNHLELRKQFEGKYQFKTESDCEVILALYQEKGPDFVDDLNGIFAFAIYDSKKDSYFIARDHMGIIPLYMGWDKYGTFYVASELKALEGICTKIELFPPGHYWKCGDQTPTQLVQKRLGGF